MILYMYLSQVCHGGEKICTTKKTMLNKLILQLCNIYKLKYNSKSNLAVKSKNNSMVLSKFKILLNCFQRKIKLNETHFGIIHNYIYLEYVLNMNLNCKLNIY